MSQQNYSPVNIFGGVPPTTDLLAGTLDGSTGVLLTIPAGRTWYGNLYCSISAVNTTTTTGSAVVYINTVGASITPSAGAILEAAAFVPLAPIGSGTGICAPASLSGVYINVAGTTAATLTFSKAGGLTAASYFTASAMGILL